MIHQTMQQPLAKRGSGKGRDSKCLIGCLGALLVLAIIAFAGYRFLAGKINEYSDPQPKPLPQTVVSDRDARALIKRMDDFKNAVRSDQPASPLVLSGNDINNLIQCHPDLKELTGKVHVTIPDNAIRLEGAIPLDALPFGSLTKGRYLNGAGTVTIRIEAGQMLLHIVSLEVRGKPLPEEFMKSLSARNMAEDVNQNPEHRRVFEKIESMSVQNGRLQIIPRNRK